jgi:hypothetical protein
LDDSTAMPRSVCCKPSTAVRKRRFAAALVAVCTLLTAWRIESARPRAASLPLAHVALETLEVPADEIDQLRCHPGFASRRSSPAIRGARGGRAVSDIGLRRARRSLATLVTCDSTRFDLRFDARDRFGDAR